MTNLLVQKELSSRPERTRISCHANLDIATGAAFVKESRMRIANATGRMAGLGHEKDSLMESQSD
jgi:hypothetical protein